MSRGAQIYDGKFADTNKTMFMMLMWKLKVRLDCLVIVKTNLLIAMLDCCSTHWKFSIAPYAHMWIA